MKQVREGDGDVKNQGEEEEGAGPWGGGSGSGWPASLRTASVISGPVVLISKTGPSPPGREETACSVDGAE